MAVPVTVLVYVGIPLGLALLLTVLVYGPPMSRAPRYRPGRPWNHEPVWFLPQSVSGGMYADEQARAHHELLAPSTAKAIEGHGVEPAPAIDAPSAATGGATGEW